MLNDSTIEGYALATFRPKETTYTRPIISFVETDKQENKTNMFYNYCKMKKGICHRSVL